MGVATFAGKQGPRARVATFAGKQGPRARVARGDATVANRRRGRHATIALLERHKEVAPGDATGANGAGRRRATGCTARPNKEAAREEGICYGH